MVYSIGFKPPEDHVPQPDDLVVTEAESSCVHKPYEDALVITVKVANSLVH